MSQRYFCESPLNGPTATLTGAESKHLASVMRADIGDTVTLFDGTGIQCEASVTSISKRDVELKIESRAEVNRETAVQLTLAVAMPKSDRQKWLIEKAVELGVAQIVPLVTQRSVVKLKDSGLERLRRAVIEASKQCGRNRLMEIAEPTSWADLLQQPPENTTRLLAHPPEAGRPDSHSVGAMTDKIEIPPTHSVIAAVGPEGGFTEEEVQSAAETGWQPMTLGPRILRIETAALKLAALILND